MMENIFNLSNIIGAILHSIAHIYIGAYLLKGKICFSKIKNWLVWIGLAVIILLNYFLVNKTLRMLILVTAVTLAYKLIFNRKLKEVIIISFISEITMMLSEILFLLVLTVVKTTNVSILIELYCGTLFTNFMITFMATLIAKIPVWDKLINKIESLKTGSNKYGLTILLTILLMSINFIFLSMYYKYNLSYIILVNSLISILYVIINFRFLNAESKYYKINNKYNNTLNSLREYEEILDVYRVSNHENKNQLLTIRSMIVKKEKNIPEYIDKLIDNKIKDDEKLMFDTNAIPAGGLRATIYSKLLVMKDKKIKFKLNVDRKVRTVELIDLGEDLMLDVCKVIGVFLDNAIEAVLDLRKKNISINLFADEEYLNIEISNNFKGDIDLTKIDDKGYTSKTKGHGYGLTLVKEIIIKNDKLKNERRINKDIFTQKLKIKIK